MSPQDVGLPTDAEHAPEPPTAPGADAEGVTETSTEAPDDVAGRVERVLLGRPASMGRREVSEGAGVEPARPAGSGTPWASRTSRTTRRCSPRPTSRRSAGGPADRRRPGQRGAGPRDDPGLRAHLRPARRVADPARRRVADRPVLRGARGPRQPLGARAAGRRRRRRAARLDLRRHRAAARLRLASPPHQRDRPHARGRRPDGALRPVRADPGRRLRRPGLVHLLRAPDERAAARARSCSGSSCSPATSSPSTAVGSSRRWATRCSSCTPTRPRHPPSPSTWSTRWPRTSCCRRCASGWRTAGSSHGSGTSSG